ncbi:MAG TPA: SH3 domain-containing protein [Kofleriaceae bacterium]|nr:SH3 domain-containing protein [Kofleriaceae bacterium]
MSKPSQSLFTLVAAGALLIATQIPVRAETVKATRPIRVMERPGEKSRVVTRLDEGDTMTVLSRDGRWIKVRANGMSGWITRSSVAATAAARTPAPVTPRRHAFVEGRKARRGFDNSGPGDRVGADATDGGDEEVLDESDDGDADEPEARPAPVKKAAPVRNLRVARAEEIDDEGDDEGDRDDGEAKKEDQPAERTVIARADGDLYSRPTSRARSAASVAEGQSLVVVKEQGDWLFVENSDGDSGWIRSSDVRSAGYVYPKAIKRAMAQLGYSSLGSLFASDGNGELANYKMGSAAASLSIGAEYIYRYSDKYLLAGDVRYIGTRGSPGIRYVNMAGDAADIGFTNHEISLGARGGYNFQNDKGMVAYGRLGYYYGKFGINDVSNFEVNLAYLPSELLTGITVGASLDIPHWSDKLGFRAGIDALYPNGKRVQTQGLEDGAVSKVFAAWASVGATYQWKPNLAIELGYRYAYAKTDWVGAADGSMRPTGSTVAARKDVGHTAMLGIGKQF